MAGTTTQAIQLVKHLVFQGHRACYIELNENGYIKALKELYEELAQEGACHAGAIRSLLEQMT